MHFLGPLFVHLTVTMFFLGLAGSAVVILISFVEDFRELFGPDESNPEGAGAPPSTPMAAGASQPASK